MVPYAKPSGRLVGQIVADVVTVVVSVGSYLAGRAVYQGILALTDPLSATAKALSGLQDRVADAAVQAGQIPGVGDSLRSPLDDIAGQIASVIVQMSDQTALIQRAAGLTGLAVFVIPVIIWWGLWLPARVRFVREAAAAKRLLAAGVGLDLFALRGLAHLPLRVLARVDTDPAAAWRDGDTAAIDTLARRELDRLGVRAPEALN